MIVNIRRLLVAFRVTCFPCSFLLANEWRRCPPLLFEIRPRDKETRAIYHGRSRTICISDLTTIGTYIIGRSMSHILMLRHNWIKTDQILRSAIQMVTAARKYASDPCRKGFSGRWSHRQAGSTEYAPVPPSSEIYYGIRPIPAKCSTS